MQNALLIGLSRQVALSRELDVVANNIANINTTGYKADGALFEEYLSSAARSGQNQGRGEQSSTAGASQDDPARRRGHDAGERLRQ